MLTYISLPQPPTSIACGDRRASHRLVRSWLEACPSDLFHVHPNQFLTNWISFDSARREALGVRLNLMPDGLANYYVARINDYDRPNAKARVSNALLGIPYHANNGTVLGLETLAYEAFWYVGSPGLMGEYMQTRRFQVPMPPSAGLRRRRYLAVPGPTFVGANVPIGSMPTCLLRSSGRPVARWTTSRILSRN